MEMWLCLIALKSLCRFLLFGMCVLLLTHHDYVARELPSEMRSTEISWCSSGRMSSSADK